MSAREQLCRYTLLDDSIHAFTFVDASREAVDEYYDHMALIVAYADPTERLRMLIDIRESGVPPIGHLVAQTRRFNATHRVRLKTATAVIYANSGMLSLMDSAAHLLTRPEYNKIAFFQSYEDAVDWLQDQ